MVVEEKVVEFVSEASGLKWWHTPLATPLNVSATKQVLVIIGMWSDFVRLWVMLCVAVVI